MAHEIETMFSTELPWHELGTVVEEAQKGDEALRLTGLDWRVKLQPVLADVGSGTVVTVPDRVAVVRETDLAVLGVLGNEYRPIQNAELFGFADALIDSGEAKYESAGALRGGRTVWCLAKLEREQQVDGQRYVPYLLVTSSHDGSSAFRAVTTPVFVVCWNTIRLALSQAVSSWRIEHSAYARSRISEAREALRLTNAYYDAFEAEAKELIAQEMKDRQFAALVRRLFPMGRNERQEKNRDKLRAQVRAIYRESDVVGRFRGSGWGALQAVNTWELWAKPIRSEERRLERMALEVMGSDPLPYTQRARKSLAEARR